MRKPFYSIRNISANKSFLVQQVLDRLKVPLWQIIVISCFLLTSFQGHSHLAICKKYIRITCGNDFYSCVHTGLFDEKWLGRTVVQITPNCESQQSTHSFICGLKIITTTFQKLSPVFYS